MRVQQLKDYIFFPSRIFSDHETVSRIGLTSLRDERIDLCLKYCRGRVLDVGCDESNLLVRKWENGVGIDVYPWEGVDTVCNTTNVPFRNGGFDTVTIIGALGHIPERLKVLQECYCVLKPKGQILVTEIHPVIGFLRHKTAWWDKEYHERGMKEGEVHGISERNIRELFEETGFKYKERVSFVFGLNSLYMERNCPRLRERR